MRLPEIGNQLKRKSKGGLKMLRYENNKVYFNYEKEKQINT